MEPKLPVENIGPERSPDHHSSHIEQATLIPTPETGLDSHGEQMEQRSEATPAVTTSTPVLPSPLVATPPAPVHTGIATTPPADDTPLVANDDDLIEKEWVDRAKKIITQTKDDPYRREQEVSKLQADYLRKRYGRELGGSQ